MEVRFEEDAMANSYKWWICILCTMDYGLPYHGFEIVQAPNSKEAILKAQGRWTQSVCVEDTFGPFNEKPTWAKEV